jgi:hypothetical protein
MSRAHINQNAAMIQDSEKIVQRKLFPINFQTIRQLIGFGMAGQIL